MRTFYILAFSQMLSMIGSGMTNIAIGLWIYSETGDTTPLMLVGFFFWIPRMLIGSIGGVLADRFNRKVLIILGDAGQAVPTLLLALSFMLGQFALWQLYVAAVIQALFGLVQGPSLVASITMLVPSRQRPRANAVQEVVGPASGLLAPSLAGICYALIGVAGVLVIDFVTFVIAVLVIAGVSIPQPRLTAESAATKGSLWHEIRGGFEFLVSCPGLFYLSLYFLFLNFVTNGVWRLLTPYLLALTSSEAMVGVLLSISSLSLMTGGLITIIWQGTTRRIDTILPSLGIAALGLIVFGMVRSPLALGVTIFLMQLPYKMSNALLNAIRQDKIPPDMQGRVFSLTSQMSTFAIPITFLVTGPIVDDLLEPAVGSASWEVVAPLVGNETGAGMGLYIIACGALLLAATLITYLSPAVRRLEHHLPDYEPLAIEDTVAI